MEDKEFNFRHTGFESPIVYSSGQPLQNLQPLLNFFQAKKM